MNNEQLTESIESFLESQTDYLENHEDNGGNYAHMPAECWCKTDDDRLIEFCSDNDINISDIDIDELSDQCLEQFEMMPGDIFSRIKKNIFNLASYAMQEHEIQIKPEHISEDISMPEMIQVLESKNYTHTTGSDHALVYIATYAIWNAQINVDTVREIIQDLIEIG